jgi:hypothetical protein
LNLGHTIALATTGKLPKPPKAVVPKLPKIAAVHIQPAKNGFKVTHEMTPEPHAPKQFVFNSPAKMLTHLKRIESTAWLHPMQNPAKRIVATQDLGEVP